MNEPDFTIGIEEEYLLVDRETMDLAAAPPSLMAACTADLDEQFGPEFLQCQVEIGTRVCRNVAEARDDLKRLRSAVARHAADHGLAPIAVSCHPFGDWRAQHHTRKDRYDGLVQANAAVSRRLLICGMHVHVGIGQEDLRIDLMNQFTYFLPHLLALSASSPYWQGMDTGLSSYRLTVFDNMPRTGLPPRMESWAEYQRSVGALIELGIIEDTSKIWWDLRPSSRFPTLESRVCDVTPRVEDALTLAALIQATMRMLWRLSVKNQRWRIYDRFLIAENRWRAQRYGMMDGLIDFGRHEIVPMPELVDEWLDLIAEDAGVLGSTREVERAREIVETGSSAVLQRQVHAGALELGDDDAAAMRRVVAHLVEKFHEDL